MKDSRLDQARAAAERILQGLAPSDSVNVIAFDDTTTSLYPSARPASASVIAEAAAFVRDIRTGAGTDMRAAIERALSLQRDPERVHQVVVITDGNDPWQSAPSAALKARPREIVDVVLVNARPTKWPFETFAETTGGRLVILGEKADDEAILALSEGSLSSPLLTDLALEAEGAELRLIEPARLPNVFPGGSIHVTARLRGQGQGPIRLHLRAWRGAEAVDHVTTINLGAEARPWVRAAWSHARIDDLTRRFFITPDDQALREEAVDLALTERLTSPFTAFVAIPMSERNNAVNEQLAKAQWRRIAALGREASGGDQPTNGGSRSSISASASARPERAGCASCGPQGPVGGRPAGLVGIGLLAAMSRRRRGRPRGATPEASRRSEEL